MYLYHAPTGTIEVQMLLYKWSARYLRSYKSRAETAANFNNDNGCPPHPSFF